MKRSAMRRMVQLVGTAATIGSLVALFVKNPGTAIFCAALGATCGVWSSRMTKVSTAQAGNQMEVQKEGLEIGSEAGAKVRTGWQVGKGLLKVALIGFALTCLASSVWMWLRGGDLARLAPAVSMLASVAGFVVAWLGTKKLDGDA